MNIIKELTKGMTKEQAHWFTLEQQERTRVDAMGLETRLKQLVDEFDLYNELVGNQHVLSYRFKFKGKLYSQCVSAPAKAREHKTREELILLAHHTACILHKIYPSPEVALKLWAKKKKR